MSDKVCGGSGGAGRGRGGAGRGSHARGLMSRERLAVKVSVRYK